MNEENIEDFDLQNNDSKKMKIAFKKYIVELVIFIFIGFLIGFLVTELVFNNHFSYYEMTIQTETTPEYIFREDYFSKRVDALNDYYNESKDSKYKLTANIDYVDITKTYKYEKKDNNQYLIRVEAHYFKDTFVNSSQSISTGTNKFKNNMTKILTLTIPAYGNNVENVPVKLTIVDPDSITLVDHHNSYLYGLLSASLMGLISVSLFFIIYRSKNKDYFLDISDNEKIFRTPFHKKYWKDSLKCFKNVRDLTILAMMFAMMLVCKLIPIPSGFGTLGISFTYLFFSVIAMVYGPTVGLIIGIFSDVLGYFITSNGGVFFPGYTLDAMLAGFTYGICFYKTKLTFTKCLFARMVVNLFINVVFGSIWWSIMYSLSFEGFKTYLLFISLPKNIVYLLPQSILLFIVLKAVARPLSAFGLIDYRIKDHITIF